MSSSYINTTPLVSQTLILTVDTHSWEELEDKPEPGQWEYFARSQHMPAAQEPSK